MYTYQSGYLFCAIVWNFLFGRRVCFMLNLSLFHKTDDKRLFTKMNPSMLFFLSLMSRLQVSGGFQQTWKCSQQLPIFSLTRTFEFKLLSRAPQSLYLAFGSMRMCRWDFAPWTFVFDNVTEKNSFYYTVGPLLTNLFSSRSHVVTWKILK